MGNEMIVKCTPNEVQMKSRSGEAGNLKGR